MKVERSLAVEQPVLRRRADGHLMPPKKVLHTFSNVPHASI